jgi:hypothetical protein
MRLSRHVRNNMRLYGISEDDIIKTLKKPDTLKAEGTRKVALRKFSGKFKGYPLKVVYGKEAGEPFIITAYPLKRKAWR